MPLMRRSRPVPDAESAPEGRPDPITTATTHAVLGTPLHPPFPPGYEQLYLAMGCFWGAERIFWQLPGIYVTAVGYAGGITLNPTYDEVCTARTGHAETVLVVYDASVLTHGALLRRFWEGHDPTQGMRQGNDIGPQYRSACYWTSAAQEESLLESREAYQAILLDKGFPPVTTEIAAAGPFYYAEAYHQQYLAKNPSGYCGIGGTGISCPEVSS